MQLNLNEAFAEDWYVGLGTNFCLKELILENTCIVFKSPLLNMIMLTFYGWVAVRGLICFSVVWQHESYLFFFHRKGPGLTGVHWNQVSSQKDTFLTWC